MYIEIYSVQLFHYTEEYFLFVIINIGIFPFILLALWKWWMKLQLNLWIWQNGHQVPQDISIGLPCLECKMVSAQEPGNSFSPWSQCNKELKMCGTLYHKIIFDQPSSFGKDRFQWYFVKTRVPLNISADRTHDWIINKMIKVENNFQCTKQQDYWILYKTF